MALTKVLDKLVQIGPGYLDQTLRTYITDNRHIKFYTDTVNNKSYAVFAFYSSGSMVLKETKKADLLIVGGGGGSSIGNLSGGSGAGAVVMIENAMLPAEEFTVSVGAGGAGATVPLWSDQYSSGDGLGSVGGDSYFEVTLGSANTIIAKGGGVGGYKRVETMGLPGGSGGGSGGAERDPAGNLINVSVSPTPTGPGGVEYGDGLPAITDATVTTAIVNKYFTGNVYSYGNEGGWADPWYYDPSLNANTNATYHSGGGGGAGAPGGGGDDTKGGDGGDGVTIPWVNEVFREVFHFNGDIYWGGGGGGAAASDEEPGNGGLGGGGGGASVRNSGDINTAEKLYYNGHGGLRGINNGYDADNLLGGAGGQNTGGGAGGSTNLTTGTYGLIENTQGNHGGSGFVLVRVHLDDAFNPFSASLG